MSQFEITDELCRAVGPRAVRNIASRKAHHLRHEHDQIDAGFQSTMIKTSEKRWHRLSRITKRMIHIPGGRYYLAYDDGVIYEKVMGRSGESYPRPTRLERLSVFEMEALTDCIGMICPCK